VSGALFTVSGIERNPKTFSGNLKSGCDRMMEWVDVQTGEVALCKSPNGLIAKAIGSCVVIAAYAHDVQVGVMAHILVGGQAPASHPRPFRFATNAVREVGSLMRDASVERYIVCLAGAANVLEKADDTVCPENILSVLTLLVRRPEARIVAADLGGFRRRCIRLDCETGSISCSTEDGPYKLLWRELS
jgi:chemotaxis receptor (MCP) glutamine deamidase CheD